MVGIAGLAGVATWPQLVGAMAEALDSGDPARVEGVLDTLYKVMMSHGITVVSFLGVLDPLSRWHGAGVMRSG